MKIISNAKKEMSLGKRPQNKYQRKTKFKDDYFEFHHILPKSIYPLWKNNKRNRVALTYKEHFFCHELLTKIYDGKNKSKMCFALIRFFGKNGKKMTEAQRKEIAEAMSKHNLGKKLSEETKLKISAAHKGKPSWNKGKHLSDETKKKLSETKRQNPHIWTEEERKAQSERSKKFGFFKTHKFIGEANGFYGKKHSQKTIDTIKEKLSKKFSGEGNPCFGRKWYHNPATMEKIYLKPDDTIPEGYIPGTGVNYHKKKS